MRKRVQVGKIGVDSGQVMVGDPCYVESGWKHREPRTKTNTPLTYKAACEKSLKPPYYGGVVYSELEGPTFGAVVARSGIGDGVYPVYVETNENGEVCSLSRWRA